MGAYLSVALNTSATSGIADLHAIAGSDIPTGQTRTMGKGRYIIQFTQRGDHMLAVASDAWYSEGDRRTSSRPPLSYATAVSLFENDEMNSIMKAFNLPREVDVGDIVAVTRAATGQDISMPQPNAKREVVLDRAGMSMMRVGQLRLLHQRTPGCRASTKKSKEKLIADIMQFHPKVVTGKGGRSNVVSVEEIPHIRFGAIITSSQSLLQDVWSSRSNEPRLLSANRSRRPPDMAKALSDVGLPPRSKLLGFFLEQQFLPRRHVAAGKEDTGWDPTTYSLSMFIISFCK